MHFVDTRTRHVYPRRRGRCSAAHVEGGPTGSAIRKQPKDAFVVQTPRFLGRDPVGASRRRLAAPSCPERPWSLVDRCPARTRIDEERGRRTTRVRVKDVYVFCFDCCVVSFFSIGHHLSLFKRGLDFPYKTRSQIYVQRVKKT